ncbi:MAG: hypothetical protein V4580_11080 [Bacteroidota bacterium]
MKTNDISKIRRVVIVFIILLTLSGITAFPLITEVDFLITHINLFPPFFHAWIRTIYESVHQTPSIVLYGTDWLAFAHIIIGLFFVGVYQNPVRNKFTVNVGIIACIAVFPLAFICGPIRHIPFYHQIIDCGFGLLGLIPLFYIKFKINVLEKNSQVSVII